MMQKDVLDFIHAAIVRILSEEAGETPQIDEKTPLLGKGGVLSSLMLVELMLALEDYCTENNRHFTWTHDSMMSAKNSPYQTIGSLAEYICSLPTLGQEE